MIDQVPFPLQLRRVGRPMRCGCARHSIASNVSLSPHDRPLHAGTASRPNRPARAAQPRRCSFGLEEIKYACFAWNHLYRQFPGQPQPLRHRAADAVAGHGQEQAAHLVLYLRDRLYEPHSRACGVLWHRGLGRAASRKADRGVSHLYPRCGAGRRLRMYPAQRPTDPQDARQRRFGNGRKPEDARTPRCS